MPHSGAIKVSNRTGNARIRSSGNLDERLFNLCKTVSYIKKLTFVSNPLRRIYDSIRLPLYLNEPGCWFEAGSGEGKSTAVEYCYQALLAEIPSLPVFVINEHTLPASALRAFFIRMLDMAEHSCSTGETARLRIRLAKQLCMLAYECPLKMVVLLIDEGQAFRDVDLFILKDLSNDMERFGVTLLTFVFGEAPAMSNRVSTLNSGTSKGIAERFVGGHHLNFHTYKSASDWRSLFDEIDHRPFALLNGKTVAEYYFQFCDISEFSFTSEVDDFWSAIKNAKHNNSELNLRKIFTGFRWAILHVMKASPKKLQHMPDGIWESAFSYAACCNEDN